MTQIEPLKNEDMKTTGVDAMQLLVIVLNKVDRIESLFKEFIDIGLKGATIIDSKGMARVLNGDIGNIPFFGSIKMLVNDQYPYNKTIFVVLEDEQVEPAIAAVKRVVKDFTKPDVGILFTIPVNHVVGLAPPN